MMDEMFEFLDKLTLLDPRVIRQRLRNHFGLEKDEADRIYKSWKKYFNKPKKI